MIPTLQMTKLRFKRIKDQQMINNQEVSESEYKSKIFQKNSGWFGQQANILETMKSKMDFMYGLRENKTKQNSNPPHYHRIAWCSWKNI